MTIQQLNGDTPTIGGSLKGLLTGSLDSATSITKSIGHSADILKFTTGTISAQMQGMYIETRGQVAKSYVTIGEELITMGMTKEQVNQWLLA